MWTYANDPNWPPLGRTRRCSGTPGFCYPAFAAVDCRQSVTRSATFGIGSASTAYSLRTSIGRILKYVRKTLRWEILDMKPTKQDYIDEGKNWGAKVGGGGGLVIGALGGGLWGAAIGAAGGAIFGAIAGGAYGAWQAERHGVCFVRGALVSTTEGFVPIELVQPDTKVHSRDMTTRQAVLAVVEQTFSGKSADLVTIEVGEDTITCTPRHRFYTDRWITARELSRGDCLLTGDGSRLEVRRVSNRAEKRVVFNMRVAETATYLVGRSQIVVHNLKMQEQDDEDENPHHPHHDD